MILIGNGRMITRDPANPYYENGAVCVKGNVIVEAGDFIQLKGKYPEAEFLDAVGGVIMPGLINTHHHIYSAMARGMSIPGYAPKNFSQILEGLWWRLDRKLTLEQTSLSACATYLDCIRNGVTTVFDHHASYGSISGSLQTIAEAARRMGVRTCLCYEVSERDGEEKAKQAVKENFDFAEYAQSEGGDMLKAMMGLHASFTLSDQILEYIVSENKKGIGYHIHVAEGIADVEDSLKKYGIPVVKRLEDRNILGSKTLAVHCVHINEEEMDILRETETVVIHNPESNMGNAVGCPKVLDMYAKGVLLGLGTDGYTSDMMETMKTANVLHKHDTKDPGAAWGEVPEMLFANNARIAGRFFDTPLGVLRPGAAADIIVTDYIPLTPMTGENYNSHILFGMSGRSVVTTMIDGTILMKDRKLTQTDEEELLARSRVQAAGLWESIRGIDR
ncbi:putative aminohydrolase SsnA [Parasporobacterium paucivorans]|uniref:Putative selenium metabolism protein SsnA n=1 Tax=Parasporobacterium paucivorans DSM 15970 TaxID=1122934 RepID=A0A1M6C6D8_9FIRM|nr:putative aminohydrolase SsnA [Parasporobacterium paucivorans]SHI56575.1 putative selenium metabolism protein SsnA [Parasporobacterium paucivorans DSM 15970]